MDPIMHLAKHYKLKIIEDACESLGATYYGKQTGTFGESAVFAFYPNKQITTGEGGMITAELKKWDSLARSLRDHGAARSDLARHQGQSAFLLTSYDHLGFNYRMTDIQASLGCAQMDRASWILERRKAIAGVYDQTLAGRDWLQTPAVPTGYEHGYQSYVCLFRPETPTRKNLARLHARRNRLMLELEEKGISTRQGTHAPVLLGYYAKKYKLRPGQFPNAETADRLTMTLPLFPQMTSEEQDRVCDNLTL